MGLKTCIATLLAEIDEHRKIATEGTPGPWVYNDQLKMFTTHDGRTLTCAGTYLRSQHDVRKIAESGIGWPASLDCLHTAVVGLCEITTVEGPTRVWAFATLEGIYDRWEAMKSGK